MHRPVERLVSLGLLALLAACGSSTTVPDAPTAVHATGGNGQATLTWTAPAKNGGSAVLSYKVASKPGNFSAKVEVPTTTATVKGLTNGTSYTFTVVATNKVGSSAASKPSNAVTPATVPGAPTDVTATASGVGQATASWSAPASDGGSPIKSYTVTSYSQGAGSGKTTVTGTTATIKGLTNGQSYAFSVYATNATGDGPASAMSADATMWDVPEAPGKPTAVGSNQSATVAWNAPPAHGSAITQYTVTAMPGSIKRSTASSPFVFDGLANGTTYQFTVYATNAVGDGQPSPQSDPVLVADVPGTPTNCSAVAGVSQATVSWNAPEATGGSPILSYTVTTLDATDGSIVGTPHTTADATTTSWIATDLLHQGYSFMVHATNAMGDGSDCSPTDPVTPVTVPEPPTNVVASAGNGHATVSWYPPTADGGSAVLKYLVTAWLADGTQATPNATVDASTTTTPVNGLTNGTTYTFKVQAESEVGDSDYSAPSNAVTPDPATAVVAGDAHSCELVADSVRCWGSNQYGQLGDDTTQQRHSPVQVSGLTTGVTAVAAGGEETCAVVNGGAQCWGYDNYGQLGSGAAPAVPWAPVPVTGMTSGVSAIAVGLGSACAIASGGAQCWGHNNHGQLGDSATSAPCAQNGSCPDGDRCDATNWLCVGADSSVPVQVDGLTSGVTGIGIGLDAACALANGGVDCWGSDTYGQLGDAANVENGFPSTGSAVPVGVTGLDSGVQSLGVGSQFACALLTDGSVQCWGRDNYGQLGDNSILPDPTDPKHQLGRSKPVPVVGLSSGVTAIAVGEFHACALANGGVQCWGLNVNGQLGNGTTNNSSVPVPVTGLTSGVTAIAAGGQHSCALTNGAVLCWGSNQNGQLGNGTASQYSLTPVSVADSGL